MTARPHSFRVPDDVWAALCGEAQRLDTTVTDILLKAVSGYLDGTQHPAADRLSAEDLELARQQFQQGKNCPHCGGLHLRACARVKRLEWRNKEELGSVEFWPWHKIVWPDDQLWPEDVFGEDTTAEPLADPIMMGDAPAGD